MSELYPNDSELLALVDDGPTGVEYIETGKAPYYLEFRRMLHRLLLHVAPLGLRVCKTGSLAIRVRPGHYAMDGRLASFAGSASDVELVDDATNCVFIAADGVIGVSSAGWPAGEHIKLASIVAANGDFDIDDITDVRGGSMLTSLASSLQTSPADIDQALLGIGATVTAGNLDILTDGSNADGLHVHELGAGGGQLFGLATAGDLVVANGQTVSITQSTDYNRITIQAGGTLIISPRILIRCRDMMTVAGLVYGLQVAAVNQVGAARTTAGAGNASTNATRLNTGVRAGRRGIPGVGGGDGTNAGGQLMRDALDADTNFGDPATYLLIGNGLANRNGGTGAGTSGESGIAFTGSVDPRTCPFLTGGPGYGGSGGALKVAGGSNRGGAGGNGGAGGGNINLIVYGLLVEAGGVIHADGGDGANGQDAIASNADGDICGGGGGGSGGGGGTIFIQYGPGGYTNNGTVRAAGGAGGFGGLGKERVAGVESTRATSNGGNGGNGSAGIVATAKVA